MKRYPVLKCSAIALICWQLAKAQDLSVLGLATSEVLISTERAEEFENAINALPVSEVPGYLGIWIEACKTGSPVKALNAASGILAVAIRRDAWALISPRYPEILDLLHNPSPDVQRRGVLIISRNGVYAREASAKALQSYVAKGSPVTREEWLAAEESVRSASVQTLVRLAPATAGTRDAIHALLARNLSTDDRIAVFTCLASEHPADAESINILIRALDDESPAVRATAIYSLDEMDKRGNPVREKAESKMIQMSASDPDPQARGMAAETLQHLRGIRPQILPTFAH